MAFASAGTSPQKNVGVSTSSSNNITSSEVPSNPDNSSRQEIASQNKGHESFLPQPKTYSTIAKNNEDLQRGVGHRGDTNNIAHDDFTRLQTDIYTNATPNYSSNDTAENTSSSLCLVIDPIPSNNFAARTSRSNSISSSENKGITALQLHGTLPPSLYQNQSTVGILTSRKHVLPPELRRIFQEVARTGACSFLPWNTPPCNPLSPYRENRVWGRKGSCRGQYYSVKKRQTAFKRKNSSLLNRATLSLLDDGRRQFSDRQRQQQSDRFGQSRKNENNNKQNEKLQNTESTCKSTHKKRLIEGETSVNFLLRTDGLYENNIITSSSNGEYTIDDKRSRGNYTNMPGMIHHASHNDNGRKFSEFTNTKQKKRNGDTGCWSSCSGSISSVGGGSVVSARSLSPSSSPLVASFPYKTLRGAIRVAVALVLDYSYVYRGGYKMSIAEKRMFKIQQHSASGNGKGSDSATKNSVVESPSISSIPSPQIEAAFGERKMRLLKMLGGGTDCDISSLFSLNTFTSTPQFTSDGPKNQDKYTDSRSDHYLFAATLGQRVPFSQHFAETGSGDISDTSVDCSVRGNKKDERPSHVGGSVSDVESGPPFTIQRVAEVLLEPERYYVQTHKLCNALEKLLLVTSSSTAFGGFTGGNTSQNQREEREIAAWADEKGRAETQHRQRRLKRRVSSTSLDSTDPVLQMNVRVERPLSKRNPTRSIGQVLNTVSSNDPFTSEGSSNLHNESENRRLTPNPLLNHNMTIAVPGKTDDIAGAARSSLRQKFVSVPMHSSPHRNYTNSALDRESVRDSSDSFTREAVQRGDTQLSNGKVKHPSISRGLSEKVAHALQESKVSFLASSIPQHPVVNRPLSPIVFSPTTGLLNGHNDQTETETHSNHSIGLETGGLDGHKVRMEILIDHVTAGNCHTSVGNSGVGNSIIADLDVSSKRFDDEVLVPRNLFLNTYRFVFFILYVAGRSGAIFSIKF